MTLTQAAQLGLDRFALDRKVRAHGWERPFPGLYRLPGQKESAESRLMAAVLAVGPPVAVARQAAAVLWGLEEKPPAMPSLVIPHDRRGGGWHGLDVVRSRTLVARADIVRIGALPVTTIPRTVCDLAGGVDLDTLREYVALACQRDARWPRRIGERAASLPRLKGAAALRLAVAEVVGTRTDSGFERRLRRLLVGAGLRPHPSVLPIYDGGRLVAVLDIPFPDERLYVEADGFRFHGTPGQLRHDAMRDNAVAGLGWVGVRVAYELFRARPIEVIRVVERALVARRAQGVAPWPRVGRRGRGATR